MYRKRLLGLLSLILLLGCKVSEQAPNIAIKHLPAIMLWAWEMPEDLRFLDTTKAGVAFLAEEILIRGQAIHFRRRAQPLLLAPGTKTIPVIRIETNGDPVVLPNGEVDQGAPLDSASYIEAAENISNLARSLQADCIQIDYDARLSERGWYHQLLDQLRKALPPRTKISITALASWCIEGKWLDCLPVDEAVPMLFQMGIAEHEVTQFLQSGRSLRSAKAAGLAGISVDEAPRAIPRHERLYMFNPRPWTKQAFEEVIGKYGTSN